MKIIEEDHNDKFMSTHSHDIKLILHHDNTTNPDSPRNLLDFYSHAQKQSTDVILVGEGA